MTGDDHDYQVNLSIEDIHLLYHAYRRELRVGRDHHQGIHRTRTPMVSEGLAVSDDPRL